MRRLAALLVLLRILGVPALCADEVTPPAVVIRDVSVFDSQAGVMLPHRTLLLAGEHIQEIGTPEVPIQAPARARTIDGAGKFVIPGLIDAHVHLVHLADRTHVTGDEFLPLFIAAGVTSVRSAGDAIVAEAGVRHFADAHPECCPRVFLASPLIDRTPPFHRDVGYSLTDVLEVPAFVDEMAAWHVTTLKLYVGTPRPIGRAVIELGHRRGMIVTGHLGAYSAQDAVEDGIDCLEHIWSVFNYSFPPEDAGPRPQRADLDLGNPRCQALVAAIAQRKVAVDPTLVVFRNMIYLNDLAAVQEHPDQKRVPERMRRYWEAYRQKSNLPAATRETRQREVKKYQELTGILHRAGVMILAGTDTPEPFVTPGYSLHQELEMLVESGLSPAAAIQAATINNARIVQQAERLGRIEPGMLADLVVLEADPTLDIRRTRQIEYVIRGGRVVVPADVLRSVPID